jgi:hypothetical protein
MLGFHRMTHGGTATVVSIEFRQRAWTVTDSRGRSTTSYNVILDVSPDDGTPTFRAQTHHQFSPLRHPDPGDKLAVTCNPSKKAVRIDLSGDARYNPKIFRKENDRERKEEHDRVLNAPPGTPADQDGPSSFG